MRQQPVTFARVAVTAATTLVLTAGAVVTGWASFPDLTASASCQVSPVAPVKTGGTGSDITFGFTATCDAVPPSALAVSVKLWRYDSDRGKDYQLGDTARAQVTATTGNGSWSASCSSADRVYDFHVEVIWSVHQSPASIHNSGIVPMQC